MGKQNWLHTILALYRLSRFLSKVFGPLFDSNTVCSHGSHIVCSCYDFQTCFDQTPWGFKKGCITFHQFYQRLPDDF